MAAEPVVPARALALAAPGALKTFKEVYPKVHHLSPSSCHTYCRLRIGVRISTMPMHTVNAWKEADWDSVDIVSIQRLL